MSLRDRLRAELTAAMKRRDRDSTALFRSALAAIDNAEAPPIDSHTGSGEAVRLDLGEEQVRAIVGREVDERRRAADLVPADEAAALRRGADALEVLLA